LYLILACDRNAKIDQSKQEHMFILLIPYGQFNVHYIYLAFSGLGISESFVLSMFMYSISMKDA
jgi:hypothetical protein